MFVFIKISIIVDFFYLKVCNKNLHLLSIFTKNTSISNYLGGMCSVVSDNQYTS